MALASLYYKEKEEHDQTERVRTHKVLEEQVSRRQEGQTRDLRGPPPPSSFHLRSDCLHPKTPETPYFFGESLNTSTHSGLGMFARGGRKQAAWGRGVGGWGVEGTIFLLRKQEIWERITAVEKRTEGKRLTGCWMLSCSNLFILENSCSRPS